MRGIRIATLLLVIGLALPGALLVQRALESLEVEREVRHRAVTERTFDEMERALSGLLAAEENRPFEQYGFYLEDPDRSRSLEDQRSPLSRPPTEAFVLGYFQIDPDGSVHSPLEPRGSEPSPPGWSVSSEQSEAIALVRELVDTSWSRVAGKLEAEISVTPSRGLTGASGERAIAKRDDAKKEKSTAYDLLQRLNVASEERAERKQKTQYARTRQLAQLEAELEEQEPKSGVLESSDAEGFAQQSQSYAARDMAAPRKAASRLPSAAPPSPSDPREVQDSGRLGDERDWDDAVVLEEAMAPKLAMVAIPDQLPPAEQIATPSAIRITLDPITSRPADAVNLILYRTVLVGEQGYRQGLVVDRVRLGDWLEARVIHARDLSRYVDLMFKPSGQRNTLSSLAGSYVYEHEFAEPFQSLQVRLALASLPGMGSASTIYLLALLLATACTFGIFALYRMAALAVQFAERRNNFVASVSHELKTPLTAIRMYAEMLRDGLVGSEEKRDEYYATITDESERLSRLVENVLEFSRLEKGSRDLSSRVGPLAPLVREVAETLGPHARREGFTLKVEADEDLPPVRYDRDAVVQVLFNLVDNAIKYARDATRREVVLECRRAKGGVVISVRDFGPGVPKRHLSRIFEPFYRGQEELTRTAKGTGIGLALVKELAQSMGAAVSGANVEDGGFCVRVAFRSGG